MSELFARHVLTAEGAMTDIGHAMCISPQRAISRCDTDDGKTSWYIASCLIIKLQFVPSFSAKLHLVCLGDCGLSHNVLLIESRLFFYNFFLISHVQHALECCC